MISDGLTQFRPWNLLARTLILVPSTARCPNPLLAIMSSYPPRFSTEERDWLLDRLKQSDVRGLLAAAGDGYLKAVADLIRPDFEKHWTKPYSGETDAEYEKRRSNAHKDKKLDFPRRLEETQEAWEARRRNLSHVHDFRHLLRVSSMLCSRD